MQRSKLALTIFAAAAAIAGSAFTFGGRLFGQCPVYCETPSATTCTHRVDFRIDPTGSVTTPCSSGNVPKVLIANDQCVTVPSTTKFSACPIGK